MKKTLITLFIGMVMAVACNSLYAAAIGNQNAPGSNISIEQAISDEAQQNTISFDGLAFLTGDLCADSFLPPGKVADFSGFQYLRDTDPTNLGHNTDFVTIIAFNMLEILTDSQIAELVTLAKSQISMINEYGYKRFPLMKAFRRLLEGDMPDGITGLNKAAVMAYSGELYQLDGEISYDRAKTLGSILRGMTSAQKAKLDALKALNGVGNWDWDSSQNNPLESLKLDKDVNVAVMTYASEMYSWYAGSVEADTYFCPERQGTYFGSFFMKDAPAMAAGPGFTIDSNLTADMGTSFLKALTSSQAALITNLVNIQREDLNAIVETRRAISAELRKFITTDSVDESAVLSLAEKYGELDGEIVYNYATNFVEISKTLSSEQKANLTAIRESWNTIPCSGAYLYSEKIAMPEIVNTDFLFGGLAEPVLTLTNQGTTISVSWTTVPGATGYMLYYAPYPSAETIGSADMKTQTGFSVDIPNAAYYVGVKAYDGKTSSDYSNIEYFVTTGDTGITSGTLAKPVLSLTKNGTTISLSWSTVPGATGYTLYYAPYPNAETIGSADMKTQTGFSADIPNAAYYVGVKAYNGNTASDYSNIVYFDTTDDYQNTDSFLLTSDAGSDGGTLPVEYTCDGAGSTIALSWSNAPAGTAEYALLMTTIALDGTKWNWVLYNIPANATGLAKNSTGVGTLGVGSDLPGRVYNPPCPQGPGAKLYTFTLYALSASPTLPAADLVTGAVLTDAISSITLGAASLNLSYARP